MKQCSEGHDNAEGQAYCGTCGESLDGPEIVFVGDGELSLSDLTSDGFFVAMALISLACIVMLVAALLGAGRANLTDRFDTYAYISGLGAGTWLVGALIAWGLAAWRVNVLRGI